MLIRIENALASFFTWRAIVAFFIGAMLSAWISVRASLKAQKPRLMFGSRGAGGRTGECHWGVSILNLPSFFGQNVQGEIAHDVYVQIWPKGGGARNYTVFWEGNPPLHHVDIEPGQQHYLKLFHWTQGTDGYFLFDSNNKPLARFRERVKRFVLVLTDRLNRSTQIPFTVMYDDSNLQQPPQLSISDPVSMRERAGRFKSGISRMLSAFHHR